MKTTRRGLIATIGGLAEKDGTFKPAFAVLLDGSGSTQVVDVPAGHHAEVDSTGKLVAVPDLITSDCRDSSRHGGPDRRPMPVVGTGISPQHPPYNPTQEDAMSTKPEPTRPIRIEPGPPTYTNTPIPTPKPYPTTPPTPIVSVPVKK